MLYNIGFVSFSDDGDTVVSLATNECVVLAFRFLTNIIGKDNVYFDGDTWETDKNYTLSVDGVFHHGKYFIEWVTD